MTNTQLHLRRFYPFLKKEFRTITKKELKNKETFIELFGEAEPIKFDKLRILYLYQNENKVSTISEVTGRN